MDIFSQLAQKIISEQENIIGPVALEQARKVPGLEIGNDGKEIVVSGNKRDTIEHLIEKYRDLFGMASVQVCKDAAKGFISQLPKDQVPPLLLS